MALLIHRALYCDLLVFSSKFRSSLHNVQLIGSPGEGTYFLLSRRTDRIQRLRSTGRERTNDEEQARQRTTE